MASKRKLEDPVDSTSAEDEPPKKIADLKKDVSETDDTDGPNTTTSELVSNIMRKLNEKYNQQPEEKDEVDEASEGKDGVDETSEGKDGVDGPSEGTDGVDGPSEGTDEVDGSLPRYNLDKSYPPAVFIFNNFKNREGSRKDVQSLVDLFNNVLGFEVIYPDGCRDLSVWADLTGDAFKELIKRIANAPFHTRFGGLVIVVMTHGEEKGNLLFHGDRYPYESRVNIERDLIAPFCGRNQLVGKPKVFILPPCRGTRHNAGVGKDEPDGPGNALPNNADILVAYSTSEGQVAIRENEHGSWYIQEFVEVVKKYHKQNHLVELLTEVHSRVAQQTSQEDGVTKNMPEFTSTLRRKLHLVYK